MNSREGCYVNGSNYLPIERLAEKVGVIGLDIGARDGISADLKCIGNAVDFWGFEPDLEECDRLNSLPKPDGVKSVRYIPFAADEREHEFDLNLYRQRGCSSKYEADSALGALFSRDDYYILDDKISVKARPLDDMLDEYNIQSPAFLKIDVQGMEVDVFRGATGALKDSLVGIRTEVSFFPIYTGQPLFAEVDQFLRPFGFVPMRWLEFHEWRRSTKIKHPALSEGEIPYSQGQMMHGDVLYLLHPESLPDDTDSDIRRLIRLGIISVCYGHFDHARIVFLKPRVRAFVQELLGADPIDRLSACSHEMADAGRRQRLMAKFCKRINQLLDRFK